MKVCTLDYCTRAVRARNMCSMHYQRWRKHADPSTIHPRGWRGGRGKTNGYVWVYSPSHPYADSSTRVLEHRLVMEEKLGRYLLPGETVHHVNGVRDDNRPENLELWVSHQPAGQRPEDLVAWAKEILDRYEIEYTNRQIGDLR